MQRFSFQNIHKKINTCLSIITMCVGVYLVGMPLFPEARLFAFSVLQKNEFDEVQRLIFPEIRDSFDVHVSGKRLVIPSIMVYGDILEGDDASVLNRGIWHRPGTSTPDQGGNSVFVAHRFQYTSGPNTFYHLDNVVVGEMVYVDWEGKRYTYEVFEIAEVAATDTYIEQNTQDEIITLYTCTPLWTAERRLVVRGRLLS